MARACTTLAGVTEAQREQPSAKRGLRSACSDEVASNRASGRRWRRKQQAAQQVAQDFGRARTCSRRMQVAKAVICLGELAPWSVGTKLECPLPIGIPCAGRLKDGPPISNAAVSRAQARPSERGVFVFWRRGTQPEGIDQDPPELQRTMTVMTSTSMKATRAQRSLSRRTFLKTTGSTAALVAAAKATRARRRQRGVGRRTRGHGHQARLHRAHRRFAPHHRQGKGPLRQAWPAGRGDPQAGLVGRNA